MKKSFKTEVFIIAANSLVLVLGFTALMFVSKKQLKQISVAQHAQSMKDFSSVVEKTILQNYNSSSELSQSVDAVLKNLASENPNFRISIIDSKGNVTADSNSPDLSLLENHLGREEVSAALSGMPSIAVRQSTVDDTGELYFATPLVLGGSLNALRLSAPVDSNIFFTGNYLSKMIFASALILVAVLFFSLLISAHVIIGIDDLKNAARCYQKGMFEYESNVRSPRELAELSETMNAMAHTIGQNVERLTELEQVRKDFVANVSHELKTPVTSIKGFSETLLDGAISDTEAARSFVSIIKTQSERLEYIIEDLLTLSSLEQDKSGIDFEETDITALLKSLCAEYSSAAKKKNIELNFTSSETHCVKKINARLFCQGAANLLDNAIKYCGEHSVIDCALTVKENGITVTVEDSGPGIPFEHSARIFERFYRVDKGRSRDQGGTGLGLSITKHIVELHGGSIKEYKSPHYESGACFEINL